MILSYIKNDINNKCLESDLNKQKYCIVCLNELENNKCNNRFCSNYNKYINYNNRDIIKVNINNKNLININYYYYYFDIVSCDEIYIDIYRSNINYKSDFCINSFMKNKLELINKYRIYENLLVDVINNKTYSFKKINKIINDEINNNEEWDFIEYFENLPDGYLYTDNLEELKETNIYKYTKIWLLKEKYKNNKISLLNITYIPIFHKEFEYLINLNLYSLALYYPEDIVFKGSFEKTFGLEKKYYSFMVKNDIDSDILNALKIYKTNDLELLKIIGKNIGYIYNLDLDNKIIKRIFDKLGELFLKDESLLVKYMDYYYNCLKIKLDLNDDNNLFPIDFNKKYKDVYYKSTLMNDKSINKKLNMIGNILDFNKYEDDKYIIYPPHNLYDLFDESFQMHNCVRNYYSNMIYSNSQIYFLREKSNPNKSLVTIEVYDNDIKMALGKYNKEITDLNILKVLDKWKSNLLNIEL